MRVAVPPLGGQGVRVGFGRIKFLMMSEKEDKPNMFQGATRWVFQFAKRMRYEPTAAEAALWEVLSGKKLGTKFRRQHPFGRFILDFYCHEKKLAIEIDGGYHLDEAQQEYDALRTEYLRELGVREIRFTNEDVLRKMDEVLAKIKKEMHRPIGV